MQILSTLVVATIIGLQLAQAPKRSEPLLVRSVVDGNTIVTTVGRVRLLGIDAPKIGRGLDTAAPFALEARNRLAALVLQRYVRLEFEAARLDMYDRHRAYVVLEDGMMVNAAMVREGFARVTTRVPLSRLAELQRAEAEARTFRRGMWGATPQLPSSAEYTRAAGPKKTPVVRVKKPRLPRSSAKKSKSKTE
jgi:endonuclease YncB( thermonuclease family)